MNFQETVKKLKFEIRAKLSGTRNFAIAGLGEKIFGENRRGANLHLF